MIRLAEAADFAGTPQSEAAVRIDAWRAAYGPEQRFLSFYTDGCGARLCIADGCAVFDGEEPNEEWISFIAMHPDIGTLRTGGPAGKRLAAVLGCAAVTGSVMELRRNGTPDKPAGVPEPETDPAPPLAALYALLCTGFSSMPPFESWYVDVSHRVRHGLCRIAAVMRDGEPVSSAMTVAETPSAVLLGAVVTAPEWRRHGFAAACVRALAWEEDRRVLISPVSETAARLYASLGFAPCGTWAEISIKQRR